ncbi:MAG: rod-binding protein [Desulfobacterales bacterium]
MRADDIGYRSLTWPRHTPLRPAADESGENGSGSAPASSPELDRICAQMESLFVHYLFKEMRNTVPEGGLIGKGPAEEIYTSMLDAEWARKLSDCGGIGLAAVLRRQMASAIEAAGDTGESPGVEIVKGFKATAR